MKEKSTPSKRPTADRPLLPEHVRGLPRLPLAAVLEDIRSAFNVGSVFRTSDAVRVGRLVLAGYTARPPNAKLAKTALGSQDAVPWMGAADGPSAVRALRGDGYTVYAVELTCRSIPLWEIDLPRPLALVFGNETAGVSEETLALCDGDLELPMAGIKNSINVATAFGIAVFEIWRRWGGEAAFV
ncbi:MAG: RNA methyltransferase [Planctomycetes bacterium]|nr:RNA methyltransferase [Planctomycetota bacterium]